MPGLRNPADRTRRSRCQGVRLIGPDAGQNNPCGGRRRPPTLFRDVRNEVALDPMSRHSPSWLLARTKRECLANTWGLGTSAWWTPCGRLRLCGKFKRDGAANSSPPPCGEGGGVGKGGTAVPHATTPPPDPPPQGGGGKKLRPLPAFWLPEPGWKAHALAGVWGHFHTRPS